MITINNELRDKVYNCAVAHGWHKDKIFFTTELMLVITEVAEAVNADRKGKHVPDSNKDAFLRNNALQSKYMPEVFKRNFETFIKDSVEDELADVAIRVLDIAGNHNIDLDEKVHFYILSEDDIKAAKCNDFATLCYGLCSTIGRYPGCNSCQMLLPLILQKLDYIVQIYHVDIDFFVEQKMKYNELREYKHGGKKY